MVGTAEFLCKATRVAIAGAGSYCTVSGNLPEISADDEIKVEYYCWEIGKCLSAVTDFYRFTNPHAFHELSSKGFSPSSFLKKPELRIERDVTRLRIWLIYLAAKA